MSDIDNFGWTDMGEYMERESMPPELDGQDYRPAPIIIEDDREGFDYNGNYHMRNGASMDTPNTPNLPYKLAVEIQQHVIREAEMNDYFIGQAERGDMATDYVTEHFIGQIEPPSLAYDALSIWFSIYGGMRHHG